MFINSISIDYTTKNTLNKSRVRWSMKVHIDNEAKLIKLDFLDYF
jgi:hypothetical protein